MLSLSREGIRYGNAGKEQQDAENNACYSQNTQNIFAVARVVGVDMLRQAENIAEQDIRQRCPQHHNIYHENRLVDDIARACFQKHRKAVDVHKQHEQPRGEENHGEDLRENVLAAEAGQRLKRSARIDFFAEQNSFQFIGGLKALAFVDLNALFNDGFQNALVQLLARQLAGQHVVEQHAAGVNIRLAACLSKAELLRRCIARGSEGGGVLALIGLHQAADAVVDDFHRAVAEQHDVFGLDVAVDNAVTVQRRQAVADLTEDLLRVFDVIKPVGERCSVDEFAQADANAVLRAHIKNLHQIALLDIAKRSENREINRRRDPPDHHLPGEVVAYQIDVFVQVRDKRKIP